MTEPNDWPPPFGRVLLRRSTANGTSVMFGEATYSFRFKLGFVRYRYSVKARYTVYGNKRDKSTLPRPTVAERQASAPTPTPTPMVVIDSPHKATEWKRYHTCCIDISLLQG